MPAAAGRGDIGRMENRTEYLRSEIDIYRRMLAQGVDPELETLYEERVAIAELELQIISKRLPHALH